jgi:hypothetical protein
MLLDFSKGAGTAIYDFADLSIRDGVTNADVHGAKQAG